MEALGTLVRRLREQRGMTQLELAVAAGYTADVISKVEQGARVWSRRTARMVVEALAKRQPLGEYEAHDFLVQSDAAVSIGGRLPVDTYLDLVHRGIVRDPSKPTAPPVARVSPQDTADRLYHEAITRFGPERVESMLHAMLALAPDTSLTSSPAADPHVLTLEKVHPPQRRPDGHVEQIIETTTARPAQPKTPEQPDTLRRHKPSAGA